ncbi:hypothetical protein [Streptomyces griseorubiginosus]|uniref:hypothetical protein n=1 Tax=Streptomyces griseorubiginosus TaxID=67304 RepID=UPI003410643A
MHWVLMGLAVLAMTVVAAGGVAGITTGWVVPWGRPKVLRPRLWGYGSLVTAAGGTVWSVLGPMAGPPHLPSACVAWAGWVLFMAGLLIQSRSHRPGRVPADPTRTSS